MQLDRQFVATKGGATIGPPKSKRSRRQVALDTETVAALRGHRDEQLREREAAGDAYQDNDLVFAHVLGRPIRPQQAIDWFRAHRKAAGLPSAACTRCATRPQR